MSYGLDLKKLVGFGSDGCSTMLGTMATPAEHSVERKRLGTKITALLPIYPY